MSSKGLFVANLVHSFLPLCHEDTIPLSVDLAKLVAESTPSSGKDRVIGDLGQLPGFEIL